MVTSLLAVVIVVYTGVLLAAPLASGTQEGIQHAQAIMALLGPTLGAVVGYYFGAASGERIAQQATQRAEQAIDDKIETERWSDEELAAAKAVIERAEQLLIELQTAEQRVGGEEVDDGGEEHEPEGVGSP